MKKFYEKRRKKGLEENQRPRRIKNGLVKKDDYLIKK